MQEDTNSKSNIFFVLILLILTIGLVYFSFNIFILNQDYETYGSMNCDPLNESCLEVLDSENNIYYKVVSFKAKNTYSCVNLMTLCNNTDCTPILNDSRCKIHSCVDAQEKFNISDKCTNDGFK